MSPRYCRRLNPFQFNWLAHRVNWEALRRNKDFLKGKFLDIGCGKKPYRTLIEPLVDTYVGIEYPATAGSDSKADILGDALVLPFRDASFDSVAAFQVMEHIPAPKEFLLEILRVLRPGGYLILTTPFMWGVHSAPYDYYRYTRYGLVYLLSQVGFEVVRIEENTGLFAVVALRLNYALARFRGFPINLILYPFFAITQLAGTWSDRIYKVETDTGSYTTIARKGWHF